MLKLYKDCQNGVHYWEAWEDEAEEKIVLHWGRVGLRGRSKKVAIHADDDADTLIEQQAKPLREDGYIEVQPRATLIVEFTCGNRADSETLDKAQRIETLMNECLGWTGNGHVDSINNSNDTIKVFCFALDTAAATKTAIKTLRAENLLSDVTITTQEDVEDDFEDPVIRWASNSLQKPASKAKKLQTKDITIRSLNGQRVQCINCRELKMAFGWRENELQCKNCGNKSYIEIGRGLCESLPYQFALEQARTMHAKSPDTPAQEIARRLIDGNECVRLRNTELSELALELHKLFHATNSPSSIFFNELSQALKSQLSNCTDSSTQPLSTSQPNFLARYRAGEIEDVWREISVLTSKNLQYDVAEVVGAALGRIYGNIQHAFALLNCEGFVFEHPLPIEPLSVTARAQLQELETAMNPFPLAVGAFAYSIGNLRFHGHFDDQSKRPIQGISVEFTTALKQYRRWLDEWTEGSPKFSVAISFDAKNATNPREPYRVSMQTDKIDPLLIGAPDTMTFLGYLRACFEDLDVALKTDRFQKF